MKKQTNRTPGERLRDQGIDRAVDHADRAQPNWADVAFAYVCKHARGCFTAEDIRLEAEANGVPSPAHERAWGGVMVRVRIQGIAIPTDRFRSAKDSKSHRAPKRIWKAVES